jgi:general secretion pathway protein G
VGPERRVPRGTRGTPAAREGFTVIELLLVLAIVATLASLGTSRLQSAVERARVARAIGDIRAIQSYIDAADSVPLTLDEVGAGNRLDPWGRPYIFNPFLRLRRPGSARRDRFLVPLNSEYDLYSVGHDGATQSPLTVRVSHDDVIRANDGGFVGLASRY